MSIVPVNVPEAFEEKPIDYAAYGDRLAATIREGGNQIGAIMEGAKMVSDKMDQAKLKKGMLSELQASAPHVLKYMKPNPSFEDVARGAYQMDVIRGAWERAKQSTPKGPDGKAMTTLGSRETFDQLAFAATPEQFQAMLATLEKYAKESETTARSQRSLGALKTGVAGGGTREQQMQRALDKGFEGGVDKQAFDAAKMAGVPEALLSKERIAKMKADAKAAADKAKADAKKLRESNLNKHRAAMRSISRGRAGQSGVDVITKIQKVVDDQEMDLRQAQQAKQNAQKALKKAKDQRSAYQTKIATYKSQIKMLEEDDPETAAAVQEQLSAANLALQNALDAIQEQQDLVLENDEIIEQVEKHKRDYKRAISIENPDIAGKFSWAESDTASVGADPAGQQSRPQAKPSSSPSPIPQETPKEKARKLYDAKFGAGSFDNQDQAMQQRIITRVMTGK